MKALIMKKYYARSSENYVYIGRDRRFYETVTRIVAPTKPSLKGP